MSKKNALVEVKVGKLIVFRARCHPVGHQTVVDSHIPLEGWLKTEVCGLLAMVAVDLAPDGEARKLLRQVMGMCGHETEGEPETLTQEQFRGLLGYKTPSVPDDLPF